MNQASKPEPSMIQAMSHIVYLHGTPGSPEELSLFPSLPNAVTKAIWAPDRTTTRPDLNLTAYFDHLAATLAQRYPDGGIHLIGFSLGAFVTLEVAHRLGTRVAKIDLVSPAAPLELGNFLPYMAGGKVFQLACDQPRMFSALATLQSAITAIRPGLLYKMIFASAQGGDQRLAADPFFQARIAKIILQTLRHGAKSYRREILGYVTPWSSILARIEAPVTLWHGTSDNWSPPAMTKRLAEQLPNVRNVTMLDGHSHYSTLRFALDHFAGGIT
jgi:pimeloyl-ACP methyl ester carboxylesterase